MRGPRRLSPLNVASLALGLVFLYLPIVILIAYWFLILSPKRSELNTARDQQQHGVA